MWNDKKTLPRRQVYKPFVYGITAYLGAGTQENYKIRVTFKNVLSQIIFSKSFVEIKYEPNKRIL